MGTSLELRALSDSRFRPVGRAAEFRFERTGAAGMRLIETPDAGGKSAIYDRAEEFKPTFAQLADYAGTY